MVATLLAKSAFARKCGVSPAAITIAVREGRLPVTGNGKVDPADPVVAAYLAAHRPDGAPVDPKPSAGKPPTPRTPRRKSKSDPPVGAAPAPKRRGRPPKNSPEAPPPMPAKPPEAPLVRWSDDGSPAALSKLGRMTLDKVARLFGGLGELESWLKSAKLKEDIRAARLKNDIAEGEVISRELVRTHVIGVVDEVNRRLLSDGAKSIAVQLYAFAESGVPVQKAEEEVAEMISKILERAKSKPARVLAKPTRRRGGE